MNADNEALAESLAAQLAEARALFEKKQLTAQKKAAEAKAAEAKAAEAKAAEAKAAEAKAANAKTVKAKAAGSEQISPPDHGTAAAPAKQQRGVTAKHALGRRRSYGKSTGVKNTTSRKVRIRHP